MTKKITIDQIRLAVEKTGFSLLSNEYLGRNVPLEFMCQQGHITKVKQQIFMRDQTCKVCKLEALKEYYKFKNCSLLATEYVDIDTKMPYICECGNEDIKSYYLFRKGQRCKECGRKRTQATKRNKYEDVKAFFEEHDCVLLDSYKNNSTPLKFQCACGNIDTRGFEFFKKSPWCTECSKQKRIESFKETNKKKGINWDYEKVSNLFKERGCVLLEKEFKGWHVPMEYQCECGNLSKITLSNFYFQDNRCQNCKSNKLSEINIKYTIADVKQVLKEKNGELTGEYIGYHERLTYKCLKCGFVNQTSFSNIKNGMHNQCRKCYIKSISGEGSIHWKSEKTDEDRLIGRATPENYEWKQKIKERDRYTCQCCGEKGGRLVAHHIFNYSQYKELRYDLKNGITLCEKCHIEYHKEFGYQDNNLEQLQEYLQKYSNENSG